MRGTREVSGRGRAGGRVRDRWGAGGGRVGGGRTINPSTLAVMMQGPDLHADKAADPDRGQVGGGQVGRPIIQRTQRQSDLHAATKATMQTTKPQIPMSAW